MKPPAPRLSNWNLVNHLLHNSDLTGPERFIAMTIAMHRNTTTGDCHPAQRTIAEITQLPLAAINRFINALRRKRVITTRKLTNNHKSPLNYRFEYDAHTLDFIVSLSETQKNLDATGPQSHKNAKSET